MTIFAGHLPGLGREDVRWHGLAFEGWGERADIAVPMLTAQQSAALADHVRRHARDYLAQLPVAAIVAAVDAAVARWLDRSDPRRREAERLLPVVTGYDPETVRLGLTSYLRTFRAPQLLRFLGEDFADPQLLDGFRPRPKGGFARAYGPGLLAHVWAGNVPGLPLWSLICGLLVKAGSIGKMASAEPLMAGWFAQTLAEIDPRLGECLAVTWWRGGDAQAEQAILGQADTVMAYGGNATLAALRERLPITTRYLPHGHKIGFGMVSRAALDPRRAGALARLAAHDVVRYEQQGCYAPQMLFVERGGRVSPAEFSQLVAEALAGFAHRHPRRALSVEEGAGIAAWRASHEMRGFSGDGTVLLGEPADSWSVVHVEAAQALAPSSLNRTLAIVALDSLDAVAGLVAPHRDFLQTAGIAASPEELFRLAGPLGRAGVTRIAALGRMTAPEAGWHHDGRFTLLDLVTITEIEHAAEAAAEGFAPYDD